MIKDFQENQRSDSMGEIICEHCGYVNWHIYCHVTGLCENCGKRIVWCDSCNTLIPEGGENWAKESYENKWEVKK